MADKPANHLRAWSYVFVQGLILVLLVFLSDDIGPTVSRVAYVGAALEWLGFIGILMSAISIRTSLTALPLPKQHSRLGTSGLYKYVRHPMYTSVIILALGIALLSGNIIKYGLVIGLIVLFYRKSVYEEHYLRLKHSDYEAYAKKTPRFIPLLIKKGDKL